MSRQRTIDCHTHILGEEAMRRLAKESPKVAPVMTRRGDPACRLEIDGVVVQNPFPRELWDTEQRLRDMDAHGVDMQVLAPTVFTFFYEQEPALALACAVLQNDEIAAEIKRHPGRFLGLGGVPLQAPELAADELKRAMTQLGLRGAMIGSNVKGRNLDDPALEPFWAAAAALGAFIFVHPHARRGGRAARLLLSQEPRRPAVRDHGRGREPGVRRRARTPPRPQDVPRPMAAAFCPIRPAGSGTASRSARRRRSISRIGPQASIGRLFYDTILHDKPTLEFLIASVGPHHVLLGSDYPFDMGNLDCVARVEELAIPAKDRDLILGGYAGGILGVTG